jgi:hypothetical protein
MEKDLEGSGAGLFKVLPRNFSVGTEKKNMKYLTVESRCHG